MKRNESARTTHLVSLGLRSAIAWMAILASTIAPHAANYDDSNGVQNRRGNATPSASTSHINDYTQQDEQVNIDPDTGVLKVLRTNQKALINDFITSAIPFYNVTGREIRSILRQMTGAEGGRAEIIQDKNAKQYWVQVICPRFQLPYIVDAVRALDQPWVRALDDGSSMAYYTARHRDIRAVDFIAEIFAGEGESDLDLGNNAVMRWDEPYRTAQYVKGAAVSDLPINQVLLDLKIYEIDTRNDRKIGLDYVAWKNGPGRNLGELIFSGMDNHERYTNASSIYNPIFPRVINTSAEDLRLVGEYTADEFSARANYLLTAAYLDFLATKGKAKVLASTKLLAKSGQGRNAGSTPALFEAVDDIVAITSNENDDGVANGTGARPRRVSMASGSLRYDNETSRPLFDEDRNPRFTYDDETHSVDIPIHRRTIDYRMRGKTGIFVEIVPHVALEACELEIAAGVSSLTGYSPDGLPILAQRVVSTQVVAPNNQPLVLSGLTRTSNLDNNARMPILGKIPIVGYLAGGETGANRETAVVFVVTPTIIAGADAAAAMTDEALETIGKARGEIEVKPPKNPFGYDQYLLDREPPTP